MCREGKDENLWQRHRPLRPSYRFLTITLMPPRPALFLLLQLGNYLSSGGGQICWLRVNAEEGEGEGRSFPRLLLRKSCSSLQPEYSWASEAATVFSVLIPPPCLPTGLHKGQGRKSRVCMCVRLWRALSQPEMTSTPAAVSAPPACWNAIIQMSYGLVKPRCGAVSAGVTADPRQALLNHRHTWWVPNGDGSAAIVSLLVHCEFIASIAWSTFKFCVHEHATNSTTCTDLGWREANHTQFESYYLCY